MPELDVDLFLRADDIKPEKEVLITNAGQHGKIPQEEGKPAVITFELGIRLPDGNDRTWTMNKTSQRTIATILGTNTDDWVGKTVTLYTVEQNVRGKIVEVVYARIPKKQEVKKGK